MIDPKTGAAADQALMYLGEMMPVLWWRLYKGCENAGFTPDQSMELLKEYITTSYKGTMT